MLKLRLVFFLATLFPFFQVVAVPTITNIAPVAFGPSRTSPNPVITITGTDFTGATAVNFGSVFLTLANFTVNNDTSITVHANVIPSASPGTVSVTVTAPSGTSSANHPFDYFTYQDVWLAYIPDFNGGGSSSIYVFDATFDAEFTTPIATIPSGSGSEEVVITPDGKFAYCPNFSSDTLTIIDTAYNATTLPHTVQYPLPSAESDPIGVAISPGNGDILLISDYGSNAVTQLDISNRLVPSVSNIFHVGSNPTSISFLPNSSTTAYVTNFNSASISVIDLSSSTVTSHTDATLQHPSWVAPFPVNENASSYSEMVLDNTLHGGSALFYTNLPTPPPFSPFVLQGFALNQANFFPQILPSPDSTIAYVTNTQIGNILRIDLTTSTPSLLSGQISTPPLVNGLSITPDGLLGYAGDGTSSNHMTKFDTRTLSATSIAVGNDVTNPGITPDQAPVAYASFTFSNDTTVQFDASASLSPTGVISKYVWDFGDGSPIFTTASPTASHTYIPGETPYTVTLTVVNSAGTSTVQTCFGQMVYNNGGPQALLTFEVTVLPLLPPTKVAFQRSYDKRPLQVCYCSKITFSPPSPSRSITPDAYLIYLDPGRTKFVGKVLASGPLMFEVCQKNKHVTYYIFSVDASGAVSSSYVKIST